MLRLLAHAETASEMGVNEATAKCWRAGARPGPERELRLVARLAKRVREGLKILGVKVPSGRVSLILAYLAGVEQTKVATLARLQMLAVRPTGGGRPLAVVGLSKQIDLASQTVGRWLRDGLPNNLTILVEIRRRCNHTIDHGASQGRQG